MEKQVNNERLLTKWVVEATTLLRMVVELNESGYNLRPSELERIKKFLAVAAEQY